MRILVDMNLGPSWCATLSEAGFEARHWRDVGHPAARDIDIIEFADRHREVVLTHDLDFAELIAMEARTGPSVVQLRATNVLPEASGPAVLAALNRHRSDLERGAIVTVDARGVRLRSLPIVR